MFDIIIFIGQLAVGLIACAIIGIFVIAGLIELYDRITGADERKQEMQKRLDQINEDYT
jgi:hypothetical protein